MTGMSMTAYAQSNLFNGTAGGPLVVPSGDYLGNITKPEWLQTAVAFERSNWAGSSVLDDPFYNVSGLCLPQQPGQVIRVEPSTNTSLYTLPPWTSLSRILYTTETQNGSIVPNSAFVLWPYARRKFPNIRGVPTVGFAHGTSGLTAECGPSHYRNLWYQYQ